MARKIPSYKFIPISQNEQNIQLSNSNAYSILELVVVVAGIGILSAIAIPNIIGYIAQADTDAAKSLLNAAAAECLQMYRSGANLNQTPGVLKRNKLPGAYQFSQNANTCQGIQIEDPTDDSSLLPTLGFQLKVDPQTNAPSISKFSTYKHPDSKNSCEQWGGCGEGGNVQAIIAEQQRIEAERARLAEIETKFQNWLRQQPPPTGPYTEDGKNVWAFNGRIVANEEKFKEIVQQECGNELNTQLTNAKNSKYDGKFTYTGNGGCTISTYLCSGVPVGTEDAFDACKKKELDDACDAELLRRKTNKVNGLFDKLSDGRGCQAVYLCNGTEYLSKDAYDSSPCGVKWVCKNVQDPCTSTQSCTRVQTGGSWVKGKFYPIYGNSCSTQQQCPPPREVCAWE